MKSENFGFFIFQVKIFKFSSQDL